MARIRYHTVLQRCSEILADAGVPLRDNSLPLETALKLALKAKVVEFAHDSVHSSLLAQEEIARDKGYVERLPVMTTVGLLFLFEGYLMQLRMVMDLWARFHSFLPNYANMGYSFASHKRNAHLVADHHYRTHLQQMDWFDRMKKCRDEVKSGKLRLFIYAPDRNGFVLYGLGTWFSQSVAAKPVLVRDYCSGLFEQYLQYQGCVLNSREPASKKQC